MILTLSLRGRPVAQGTTVGGRPGRGLGQPGERRYAVRTTLPGLIVAEIVHTVVLSLRAHRLVAQPFIVVGLVAVIRKILLVLSDETSVDTTQLWLLIAMVVAFVAGHIAVSRFETVLARGDDPAEPPGGAEPA